MEAVILAGGFATRLYPLTLDKAKPLLEVAGRPTIMHILDRLFPLKEAGLTRIHVVVAQRFVADFETALAGPFPVPVVVDGNGAWTVKDKLGAIGDMAFGASQVAEGEAFWVLAGDNIFDYGLLPGWQRYVAMGESVVYTHLADTVEETTPYNNVTLSQEGRLLEFIEKPRRPEGRLFATCMYVFPHRVRRRLAEYLDAGNDPDKAGNFIKWLAKREDVFTLKGDGKWFDIGSVEELRVADEYFCLREDN